MNVSKHQILRATALTLAAILLAAIAAIPASAQPVLYRIDSMTGTLTAFGAPYPDPVIHADWPHVPGASPTEKLQTVNVVTNGTGPASLQFPGGQFNYSVSAVNPSPATGFGVFYQQETYVANDNPGTFGPNPSYTTSSMAANGFPVDAPWFTATQAQGANATVRVRPGPAKFGGTWDLGVSFNSRIVFATIGGGFIGGRGINPQAPGGRHPIQDNATFVGIFHGTNPFAGGTFPQFSSTQCPASPAVTPGNLGSCGFTTYTGWQQEGTEHRWTTGTASGMHDNPGGLGLPPVSTLSVMGTDNRSGPLSSMGTLQMVTGRSAMGRGAVNAGGYAPWKMTITFMPEPGAAAMLAVGCIGLVAVRRRMRG